MSDTSRNTKKPLPLPRIGPQKRFQDYTPADFQARLGTEREDKKEKYSEQMLKRYMENFEIGLLRRVEAAISAREALSDTGEKLSQAVPTVAQTAFQNPWVQTAQQQPKSVPSSRERSDADLKSRREIERVESLSNNVGRLVVEQEKTVKLLDSLREEIKNLESKTGGGGQGNQQIDVDLRRRQKSRGRGGIIGNVVDDIAGGLAILGGVAVGSALTGAILNKFGSGGSSSDEGPDIAFPQEGPGASGPEGTDVDGLGLRQEPEVATPEVQPQARPPVANVRAESGTFRRAGDAGNLTVTFERTADGKHYIDDREVDAQTYNRFMQLKRRGDPRRDPRHRQYTEEERARGDDFAPEFTADRRIRDEDNAELSRIIQTVRTQPRVERPAAAVPSATPAAAPVPAAPPPRPMPDASGPEGSDVGGLGLATAQPPPAVPAAATRTATDSLIPSDQVILPDLAPSPRGDTSFQRNTPRSGAERRERDEARRADAVGHNIQDHPTNIAYEMSVRTGRLELDKQYLADMLGLNIGEIAGATYLPNGDLSGAVLRNGERRTLSGRDMETFQRAREEQSRQQGSASSAQTAAATVPPPTDMSVPPAAGPRISSGRPSRITGPRPAPVLGEGGDLAGGFAGGADATRMGLTQQTPAAPAATPVAPARDFGREYGMATEARATAEQELASFRETAGPARVREGRNLQQETYYDDEEVNTRYRELSRNANRTRRQEEIIQRQHQFSLVGIQPDRTLGGIGPDGMFAAPNEFQMVRMIEILKSRYNYTDEQLQSLPGLRGNYIEVNGKRYPKSIVGLFNRHANEDLVRSAHDSALQDQSDAAAVPPSVDTPPPAPPPPAPVTQEPVSPAAATPAPRTGNMLSRLFSRSSRPRETTVPVLGQGGDLAGGFAGGADASGMGPTQQTPAPATRVLRRGSFTVGGLQVGFFDSGDGRYVVHGQDVDEDTFNRFIEIKDRQIEPFDNEGRETRRKDLVNILADIRAGITPAPAARQESQPASPATAPNSAPIQDDLARTISNREVVSEALMPKDPVNQVDPMQYLRSDLLLKANKITFKGDEIEFLSGTAPMGAGSFIPPSVFGGGGQVGGSGGGSGPAPSTGGEQAEGGAMPQATAAGTAQPGDVSGLKFAPGVDKRISDDIAQKVKQTETASGESLTITSGFRDPARNAAAGGARNSAHTTGKAVDVRFQGGVEDTVKLIQKASASGIGGIGVYRPGFVHLDTGPKRVWGPDYTARSIPDWAKTALQEHMTGQRQEDGGSSDASAVSSAGPSAAAESMGSAGGGSSATPVESSSGGGAELVSASTEAEVQDRSTPSQSQPAMESSPDTDASNPSLTTGQYSHDASDPGSVEPEDAAERYLRLFNMAA